MVGGEIAQSSARVVEQLRYCLGEGVNQTKREREGDVRDAGGLARLGIARGWSVRTRARPESPTNAEPN